MAIRPTTVTCLFYSKTGALSVRLLDQPVPETKTDETFIPPGVMHAVKALGWVPPPSRTWRRVVEGAIPVFEEE